MTPQQKYYMKNKIKQQNKQKLNYKEKKFGLEPSKTFFSIQYIEEGYNPFIHCLGKKISS
jgi:hypothetical protein